MSGSPNPERTLIASMAAMQPTVPETAPKTGNSRFQALGSSGSRQRRHGVVPATIVVRVASRSYIAHSTIGVLLATQAAFMAKPFGEEWGTINHHDQRCTDEFFERSLRTDVGVDGNDFELSD